MRISSLHIENNIFLAPMAGITNLPYRLLMKAFGAGLVYTEMVSANGLIRDGRRTRELLCSDPAESPLGVQLFGDDPDVLARAAALVREDGALLDLNLGCPVKKVVRSGAGSALLRDPGRVRQVIRAVRAVSPRPFTVKIRTGWDQSSINFLEIGRIAEGEGVDAITLHPRTRAQGFSGQADWEQIRQLKAALAIPVIGSGDLYTARDALAMLDQTGCDGVMIGRGSYGNPWLFRDFADLQQGRPPAPPTAEERLAVACRHLDLSVATFGPEKAALEMRKHLCWYSRGLPGAAPFRSQINQTTRLAELQGMMSDFFSSATGLAP